MEIINLVQKLERVKTLHSIAADIDYFIYFMHEKNGELKKLKHYFDTKLLLYQVEEKCEKIKKSESIVNAISHVMSFENTTKDFALVNDYFERKIVKYIHTLSAKSEQITNKELNVLRHEYFGCPFFYSYYIEDTLIFESIEGDKKKAFVGYLRKEIKNATEHIKDTRFVYNGKFYGGHDPYYSTN